MDTFCHLCLGTTKLLFPVSVDSNGNDICSMIWCQDCGPRDLRGTPVDSETTQGIEVCEQELPNAYVDQSYAEDLTFLPLFSDTAEETLETGTTDTQYTWKTLNDSVCPNCLSSQHDFLNNVRRDGVTRYYYNFSLDTNAICGTMFEDEPQEIPANIPFLCSCEICGYTVSVPYSQEIQWS